MFSPTPHRDFGVGPLLLLYRLDHHLLLHNWIYHYPLDGIYLHVNLWILQWILLILWVLWISRTSLHFCNFSYSYNIRHMKWTKIKIIPSRFLTPLNSTHNCSTMVNIPPMWELRKHFSDIDIGKILRLAKVAMPQRKIAALMKCSKNVIQNILSKYLFETFQGLNSRWDYPWKTSKHEDRYILYAL